MSASFIEPSLADLEAAFPMVLGTRSDCFPRHPGERRDPGSQEYRSGLPPLKSPALGAWPLGPGVRRDDGEMRSNWFISLTRRLGA